MCVCVRVCVKTQLKGERSVDLISSFENLGK